LNFIQKKIFKKKIPSFKKKFISLPHYFKTINTVTS
jgi:hypothetical protein